MIKAYTTLAGARRAYPTGPIIRVLTDPEELFIAGIVGSTSIIAVNPKTGRADGSISVLDLMAGGPDAAAWLIWSNEHRAWWRPAARGYTGIIEEAGRYTKAFADRTCREANFGGLINEVAVLAPAASIMAVLS